MVSWLYLVIGRKVKLVLLLPLQGNDYHLRIRKIYLKFTLQVPRVFRKTVTMVIKSAEYIISSPELDKCPPADKPEYAFIGRSNVGKSSLINMLVDNQKLAKTSGTPGKTQLINHFLIKSASDKASVKANIPYDQWFLVDLPGYGFAKVSINARNRWEQMIEQYLRKRETLVNIFVLIDARHTPQSVDLEFVNKLGKWEVPFTLVFTKADKESQRIVSANIKSFLDRLRETWQFLPQHFVTSAVKKQGRDKILQFIEECNMKIKA
jgi:GTP-binding protein